jgi:hypothetical protein
MLSTQCRVPVRDTLALSYRRIHAIRGPGTRGASRPEQFSSRKLVS